MALGLEIEDKQVGELYLERERSWLAPELPYQYLVLFLGGPRDIASTLAHRAGDR